MKLYTEEQMRVVYNLGFSDSNNNFGRKEDETINFFTPIELPSDEEIEEQSWGYREVTKYMEIPPNEDWYNGAKWMKDKIQGGNK